MRGRPIISDFGPFSPAFRATCRTRIDKRPDARHGRRMTILAVALGGALGAALRYLTTLAVSFPLGTLAVNVLGSFVMGLCLVIMADKGLDRWQPLVMTGVLGGFTTFSAFSLDALRLWEAGQAGAAVAYVLGSVALSLLAIVVAVALARGLTA